jgi:hypothetical protein
MRVSRGGLGFVTVALAVVVSVAACGSPSGTPTGTPTTNPSPTFSYSAPAPSQATDLPTAAGTDKPLPGTNEGSTGPFDFTRLNGQVPEPTKVLLAPSDGTPINSVGYAVSVFKSQRDFWEQYLKAHGFEMPRENLDLVSPGDSSTSPCHAGQITKDYPAVVYCSDNEYSIIPMTLLAHQWGGTRKVGDLAAATTVSRTAVNSVIISLSAQLNVAAPNLTAELYVGSCLTGVWAHSVYPQGTFTDKDLQAALARASAVHYELSGAKATANADVLTTAWVSGFNSGRPADCMSNFWTKTS